MAFTRSPGVAQAALVGKWANLIDIRQVFHVQRRGELLGAAWDVAALTAAANRVSGAYLIFCDNISNVCQFSEVSMRDLSAEDGAVSHYATSIAGTSAAVTTGPYEGPVIRWLTGKAGRTNGRTFLPGIDESAVDNVGMLSSARIGAMATRAAQFLTFLGAATDGTHPGAPLDLVIQSSKVTNDLDPTRPANVVVGSNCRAEVGIQRRRRLSQ